jgi:hypothetical protein
MVVRRRRTAVLTTQQRAMPARQDQQEAPSDVPTSATLSLHSVAFTAAVKKTRELWGELKLCALRRRNRSPTRPLGLLK